MSAIEVLTRRVEENPDDAVAHYKLAILLLAKRDLYAFFAPDDDGVLAGAEQLLQRAVEVNPKHARSHAALGFTRHQLGDRLDLALSSFQVARKLNPKNQTVDVYVPTILTEMGREEEAQAEIARVGRRWKVGLAKLRRDLAKVGFDSDAATLLTNGFIHARNYLWSQLSDEAERIRDSLDRTRKRRRAKAELDECAAQQRELKREFRAARVPASIRPLASVASRFGIGDDVCRPLLMKRIPRKDRARLIKRVDALASKVDAWLDTFPEGKMSAEAAAFMYLLSGVDEIR